MGLRDILFPSHSKQEQEAIVSQYFKTLTSYQPRFTSIGGGIYEAQITRAAIHSFAIHASKLDPEVIGTAQPQLQRMIKYRPNRFMTTSQFLYRVATILSVENTAFVVPVFGKDMHSIEGIYPVLPSEAKVVEDKRGEAWIVYRFRDGSQNAVRYRECAVLTQFQYNSDFFGASNATLQPTLQMIHTQNEGITEGVKSSATVRFMARLANAIRPDDLKAERQKFVEQNLKSDNGGVMMFDTKYADVKQLTAQPFVVSADQMKIINESVFNYFGVSESILRNDWDEKTYNAFYEGKIEPFAIQLGQALTAMCYTDREVSSGNSIMFSANRLDSASTDKKLAATTQLVDRGMMSRNEAREKWQLKPIPGGDEFVIRGEYVSADAKVGGEENDNE